MHLSEVGIQTIEGMVAKMPLNSIKSRQPALSHCEEYYIRGAKKLAVLKKHSLAAAWLLEELVIHKW